MYYVYILRSRKNKRYYIGCTKNLSKRLKQHNRGENRSTKSFVPWEVVCYKRFDTKEEAFLFEKKVKSYKGGNAFRKITSGKERWQSGRLRRS